MSPIGSSIRKAVLAAVLLAAFGINASIAGAAQKTYPVDIRVLTADGKMLADQRQYVAPVGVKTSPKADCFGQGTGGSGNTVQLKALTALGALFNAAPTNRSLRPTLLTDHDFGFPGLGLCGIGGPTPTGDFWFVKVDDKRVQTSGDLADVKRGGSVLWYRMSFADCDPNPPFPCASELKLRTPVRTKPGKPFQIRVTAIDDAGKESPVEGARVHGALRPTDARGRTQVRLDRTRRVFATKDGHVRSRTTQICVNERPSKCPARSGLKIVGSAQPDRIIGTPGPDVVRPRKGPNRVNVRGGGQDRVICGGRRQGDVVIADHSDVVRGCKTVRRR